MRNSSLPGLGREHWGSVQLHGFARKIRQPEKYAQQEPKICVHYIVLIVDECDVTHRNEQSKGIPKNDEAEGKPGSPPQTPNNLPCRKSNSDAKNNPEDQTC